MVFVSGPFYESGIFFKGINSSQIPLRLHLGIRVGARQATKPPALSKQITKAAGINENYATMDDIY